MDKLIICTDKAYPWYQSTIFAGVDEETQLTNKHVYNYC